MKSPQPSILLESISKSFTLHAREGLILEALRSASLEVHSGECVVVRGPSGAGKSTLLRLLYGNYKMESGGAWVRHQEGTVDLASASSHEVLALRRLTIGYVSQFLRVIPRLATLQVVAEPARKAGLPADEADERARRMLARLGIPERLWSLPPATFSGGEKQRVNLARVFCYDYPVLLLDEPTASLDEANSSTVLELIAEARQRGAAVLAVFHDQAIAARAATRTVHIDEIQKP
jgi:alpha-D-ribose 1-methylphosphonate 5-triphosphate synthase subunit PhnL